MRTRSSNALPLDDDLVDQILTSLPSFGDLQSTILSSNLFYKVFKARPNSIVEAVAYNEVGPALPEALRACRYKSADPLLGDARSSTPITCTEVHALVRNLAVVRGLEGVFSSRYKDRSSKTSKLNFLESWRFHRAIYTLSLFTAVFPGYELYSERDISNIQRKQAERTAFLTQFPNDRLLEIESASRFLVGLLRWCVVAGLGSELWDRRAYGAWAASFGPNLIWSIYSKARTIRDIGPDMEEASDNIMDSYIFPSILDILKQRGGSLGGGSHLLAILDENYRHEDKCQMCHMVCGHNLWNETNWDVLEGVLSAKTVWTHILVNAIRAHHLLHLLHGNSPSFTFSKLFHEMPEQGPNHAPTWNKKDWLCSDCINEMFGSRLAPWLLMQKRLAGHTIKPNCWDGYNCEIQGINNHGERFNHLCEPIPQEARKNQDLHQLGD